MRVTCYFVNMFDFFSKLGDNILTMFHTKQLRGLNGSNRIMEKPFII